MLGLLWPACRLYIRQIESVDGSYIAWVPRLYSRAMNNADSKTGAQGFDVLALRPELLANLADLGFATMTEVQAQALPKILDGVDLTACAKTGSGKTAAFGLGVLQKLDPTSFRVQALVLCPTRELAEQVCQELRRLARQLSNVKVLSLCGGQPLGPQIGSLQHSAHIIVGTPGRVLKHLGKQTLHLTGVETLVLDEADRMLDMGFSDELEAIIEYVPTRRQTLLFSATYPDGIQRMSRRVQNHAQFLDVTDTEQAPDIEQYWVPSVDRSGEDDRASLLIRALHHYGGDANLVFCNTKIDCANVTEKLNSKGMRAIALHGDLEQADRTLALIRFANRSASVLVATDVAARGLDITGLSAVFNYELPNKADTYLHRVGRTGRAGQQGCAVSLVSPREVHRLSAIAELANNRGLQQIEMPEQVQNNTALRPTMQTIEINGGRKNKLRAGDLLGALTAGGKIPGSAIGKIDMLEIRGFVAIAQEHCATGLELLNGGKIKGKSFRARKLG